MQPAKQAPANTWVPAPGSTRAPGRRAPNTVFLLIGYAHGLLGLHGCGDRARAGESRHLQFLDCAPHLSVPLQQRRIRGRRKCQASWDRAPTRYRGDAAMIDRYSGRGVIKRGRELDGAVAAKGNDRLNRTLAEGSPAHEFCPMIVLQKRPRQSPPPTQIRR